MTFTGEFGAQALSPRELTAAQLNRLVQVRVCGRRLCLGALSPLPPQPRGQSAALNPP